MTRWNLVVPDKTDRMVRMHIASNGGKKGDLSKFVDKAVRQRIFHETVREIKKTNASLDPQEAQRLADEAKLWLGLVKIVLDNVLVSALITKDTPPDQLS